MEWNYIIDKQPENGSSIIQIDRAYDGHYPMGMIIYDCRIPFEELLKYNLKKNWPNPDFWWIYAKDFPFPEQPERSKREDSICSLCEENYKRLDDDLCEGCRSGEQINQLIFGDWDAVL